METKAEMRQSIIAALADYRPVVVAVTGNTFARAWEIRRRSAAHWRCALTEIVWTECIKLAKFGTVGIGGLRQILPEHRARNAPRYPNAKARHKVGHKHFAGIRSNKGRGGFVSRNVVRNRTGDARDGTTPFDWDKPTVARLRKVGTR